MRNVFEGQPSPIVEAARGALTGALSPSEVDHIQQLDWQSATVESLFWDDVYLKAVAAILPLVEEPTAGAPSPLEARSGGAKGGIAPRDSCQVNCDSCRATLTRALDALHRLVAENLERGRKCGVSLLCSAAVLVRHAQLMAYVTFATGCLAVATLTTPQVSAVLSMMSTCAPSGTCDGNAVMQPPPAPTSCATGQPDPLVGGQILDGTYVLQSTRDYGAGCWAPTSYPLEFAATIRGTAWRLYVRERRSLVDPTHYPASSEFAGRINQTVAVHGSSLSFIRCDGPDDPASFTATPTQLMIFQREKLYTFARQ